MLVNDDFYQEFLTSLNIHKIQYMIFGGFAVNMYGFTRVTEDLDVWIDPEFENLGRFKNAVISLGFPEEKQLKNFLSGESIVLRLSDDAFRIDLLTKLNIKKNFSEAFQSSEAVNTCRPNR